VQEQSPTKVREPFFRLKIGRFKASIDVNNRFSDPADFSEAEIAF
jgi:hypothetical protein